MNPYTPQFAYGLPQPPLLSGTLLLRRGGDACLSEYQAFKETRQRIGEFPELTHSQQSLHLVAGFASEIDVEQNSKADQRTLSALSSTCKT